MGLWGVENCIFFHESSRKGVIFYWTMICGRQLTELDEMHLFGVALNIASNVVLATLELNMYSVGDLLAKLTIFAPWFSGKTDKNMRTLLMVCKVSRGLDGPKRVNGRGQEFLFKWVVCKIMAHCFMLFEGSKTISFPRFWLGITTL